MSIAWRMVLLVSLWLLAWGDLSPGNVLSGILLSAMLLVVFPPNTGRDGRPRPNPVAIVRLAAYIVRQLVTSNVLVAREILSPGSRVHTGVLAYQVRHPADEVITGIANIIALTPGTMTVEATNEPAIIYVHFLLLDDEDAARTSIGHLEDLVVAALGGPAMAEPTDATPARPDDPGERT